MVVTNSRSSCADAACTIIMGAASSVMSYRISGKRAIGAECQVCPLKMSA